MPQPSLALARDERMRIRPGNISANTAGLAPSHVQANRVILPHALTYNFLRFAQANRKPYPVIAVSEPGNPLLAALGRDIDQRTDLPRHRVRRHGARVAQPINITHLRRHRLVGFAIGCSLSFEAALIETGIGLRRITNGCNVPMVRTSIQCVPAGVFHGPLVVSMRPLRQADAIRAVQIMLFAGGRLTQVAAPSWRRTSTASWRSSCNGTAATTV